MKKYEKNYTNMWKFDRIKMNKYIKKIKSILNQYYERFKHILGEKNEQN